MKRIAFLALACACGPTPGDPGTTTTTSNATTSTTTGAPDSTTTALHLVGEIEVHFFCVG